jgi:plasmid stabilization system protein ParE
MRVRFTLEALGHIAAIHTYIAQRNPVSATRVVARIFAAAEWLGEFPHIGHAGLAPDTREWPVRGLPYILVHEVQEDHDEVVILGVFHGAQDRQRG